MTRCISQTRRDCQFGLLPRPLKPPQRIGSPMAVPLVVSGFLGEEGFLLVETVTSLPAAWTEVD